MSDVKIGRPLKFDSPEDLELAIERYLNGTPKEEWTVTGLCLEIGTSKQVLNDYGSRGDYKEVVQRAKLHIENAYELSLRANGRSGDIFALKNFGWKDAQAIDHSSTDGSMSPKSAFDTSKLSNEVLAEILAAKDANE